MGADSRALWRVALAATVLAACVDGPTAPGRFGELRIRPAFGAGDEPAEIGVTPDSTAVRITRAMEPAAPLVDTALAYASDTASVGWVLDLRADAESLQVEITLWGGGTRLYQGSDAVQVRGSLADATNTAIPVAYVGPPVVATVTVAPPDTLEALGATASLSAVARDRHGVVVPGATVVWSSDDHAVATVDPASGVVTAVGNGAATITATAGGRAGTTTVVVAQRVASVTVAPAAVMLTALGATQALNAELLDANGHAVAGAAVMWSSGDTLVATVDAAGVVTAVEGGSAEITATSQGVAGTAAITVNPVLSVAAITVSPATDTVRSLAGTAPYHAVAYDAQGNVLAGVRFTWSVADPAVATVDSAGVARPVAHGSTIVTATAGTVTGGAGLTVDLGASIAVVVVYPEHATVFAVYAAQPFRAEAHDAAGNIVPVVSFTWTSSAVDVASVDDGGVARAHRHGTTTIRAAVRNVWGEATLAVDLTPTVASVVVTPPSARLERLGATVAFSAQAYDAAGNVVPGAPLTWSSDAPSVATVDAQTGVATATGHGTTGITATSGAASGAAALTVDLQSTIARVVVSPAAATVHALGGTQAFTAVALDAQDAIVPGIAFTWSSSALEVATIDPVTGLATARGNGIAVITASAGTVSGTGTLEVEQRVVSITVTPDSVVLTGLEVLQQFAAVAYDGNGHAIANVTFTWSSSDPTVARIDATGLAESRKFGNTIIRAAASGVMGTALLVVQR